MIKIMLVEDDKSLREIYGVRLLAEGYDIVSAGDGEEALAMAIKERPQLIISDVMMPKVSGYDMLDILRSTTETKNIRVIMMTALSSEEQRTRAESLGADRYLVKSQVGIEDVVRVVHEVLGDTTGAAAPAMSPSPADQTAPTVQPAVASPATNPVSTGPAPAPQPVAPASTTLPVSPTASTPAPTIPTPTPTPAAPATPPVASKVDLPEMQTPKPASLKTRVIQPLSDPSVSPIDINELLNKELAKEASLNGGEVPTIPTADEEKALVDEQLQSFRPPEPTPVEPPTAPQPEASVPQESIMPTPGVSEPAPAPTPAPTTTPEVVEQENPVSQVPPTPPAA